MIESRVSGGEKLKSDYLGKKWDSNNVSAGPVTDLKAGKMV